MTEDLEKRSIAARIGICALNLGLPGLGLVRLARYRHALFFFGLVYGTFLALVLFYMLVPTIGFGQFSIVVVVALLVSALAWVGSIIVTWKGSGNAGGHRGHAWRWYGVLAIWLASLAVTWVLADFARSYHRGYYLPSESMEPTLKLDDRFMVDLHDIGPIRRGDIVIVRVGGEEWIKRVAGIPGDRIGMRNGVVFLNGKAVEQELVGTAEERTDWGATETVTILREQFPGEATPHSIHDTQANVLDNSPEIVLPPGGYFLLGDNRDKSADSRLDPGPGRGLGIVPREAIVGRFAFRYWRSGEGFGPGAD